MKVFSTNMFGVGVIMHIDIVIVDVVQVVSRIAETRDKVIQFISFFFQ